MNHPVFHTKWYLSLLFTSAAFSLSAITGYLYTHSKAYKDEEKKNPDSTISTRNVIFTVLASFVTAVVLYSLIFALSGYVPMGKIGRGI